jgi:hypothetical protein
MGGVTALPFSKKEGDMKHRVCLDEVTSAYDAPDFVGGIPRHYKDGIGSPVNPLFGGPRTMLNPRQLQFAVKLSF